MWLLLGEVCAYTFTFIASLQSWRGSFRWHALNRALSVTAALIALVAVFHGPAAMVGGGIGFGAVTGTSLGLFIRWNSKNRLGN